MYFQSLRRLWRRFFCLAAPAEPPFPFFIAIFWLCGACGAAGIPPRCLRLRSFPEPDQFLLVLVREPAKLSKKKELKYIPGIAPLTKEFKNKNSLEPEKEFKGMSSKRAQDLTFLGDILKSRDHYAAAILEYRKAKEESTTHSPVLFNKLAHTYIQTGKYDVCRFV